MRIAYRSRYSLDHRAVTWWMCWTWSILERRCEELKVAIARLSIRRCFGRPYRLLGTLLRCLFRGHCLFLILFGSDAGGCGAEVVRISREKPGPGVDPISLVVAAGGRAKEVLDLRLWDALVASALCGQGKLQYL